MAAKESVQVPCPLTTQRGNIGVVTLSRPRGLSVARLCFAVALPIQPICIATRVLQVFGRKRHAVAVAHCKRGSGMVRVNGAPIETVQPSILRYKVLEPLLLLGKSRFDLVDIRIRVRGGGYTSQIYGMGPWS